MNSGARSASTARASKPMTSGTCVPVATTCTSSRRALGHWSSKKPSSVQKRRPRAAIGTGIESGAINADLAHAGDIAVQCPNEELVMAEKKVWLITGAGRGLGVDI